MCVRMCGSSGCNNSSVYVVVVCVGRQGMCVIAVVCSVYDVYVSECGERVLGSVWG